MLLQVNSRAKSCICLWASFFLIQLQYLSDFYYYDFFKYMQVYKAHLWNIFPTKAWELFWLFNVFALALFILWWKWNIPAMTLADFSLLLQFFFFRKCSVVKYSFTAEECGTPYERFILNLNLWCKESKHLTYWGNKNLGRLECMILALRLYT